jgi:hypothetical protein|tara:strand:+ start:608 stop:811 length:204 start_codon:yes stop_codon:yes gene_type:complete
VKVGDLVIRKQGKDMNSMLRRRLLGPGIILSKQLGGSNPVHPCITVYYPKAGKIWDIAESLVEVISE